MNLEYWVVLPLVVIWYLYSNVQLLYEYYHV